MQTSLPNECGYDRQFPETEKRHRVHFVFRMRQSLPQRRPITAHFIWIFCQNLMRLGRKQALLLRFHKKFRAVFASNSFKPQRIICAQEILGGKSRAEQNFGVFRSRLLELAADFLQLQQPGLWEQSDME